MRTIYLVLKKPDSLITLINEIPGDKFSSELHFYKGQLLLDKLALNEDIPEEDKIIIAQKAEDEFKKILDFSEDRKDINGYIGLLDLYTEIGEERKKDILTAELISNPRFSVAFLCTTTVTKKILRCLFIY